MVAWNVYQWFTVVTVVATFRVVFSPSLLVREKTLLSSCPACLFMWVVFAHQVCATILVCRVIPLAAEMSIAALTSALCESMLSLLARVHRAFITPLPHRRGPCYTWRKCGGVRMRLAGEGWYTKTYLFSARF